MTHPIQPPKRFALARLLSPLTLALALALGMLTTAAGETSICRWIDDKGQTHLSDVVPAPYQARARCSDSQHYELTPEQQQEADQRAAEQAEARRLETAKRARESVTSPALGKALAPPPRAKRPSEAITADTDCPTRWRLYQESMECFGPYRTTRGATKPEGFEQCNDIRSPEVQCGPPSN